MGFREQVPTFLIENSKDIRKSGYQGAGHQENRISGKDGVCDAAGGRSCCCFRKPQRGIGSPVLGQGSSTWGSALRYERTQQQKFGVDGDGESGVKFVPVFAAKFQSSDSAKLNREVETEDNEEILSYKEDQK
jgi:hypothetical protein